MDSRIRPLRGLAGMTEKKGGMKTKSRRAFTGPKGPALHSRVGFALNRAPTFVLIMRSPIQAFGDDSLESRGNDK